jgi:hypothetical protein
MATTWTEGKVTITYNGVDLTPCITSEGAQVITFDKSLRETFEEHKTTTIEPWGGYLAGEITFSLQFVRGRPAAPIPACLWRRNLDGGKWRKRGHVAHREG